MLTIKKCLMMTQLLIPHPELSIKIIPLGWGHITWKCIPFYLLKCGKIKWFFWEKRYLKRVKKLASSITPPPESHQSSTRHPRAGLPLWVDLVLDHDRWLTVSVWTSWFHNLNDPSDSAATEQILRRPVPWSSLCAVTKLKNKYL